MGSGKGHWLPEPKSNCWAWFQPLSAEQSTGPRPRDAAALPHNAHAHQERNRNDLWGHKAFRLSPAIYVGPGLGEMVIVQELNSQTQIKLRPGLVLDWYEGLLVIESLVRSSEPCEWLNQVSDIFQKEKSQRTLSSSLYVSKKLMDAAVTGPQFVTREGATFAHRRYPLRSDSSVAEAEGILPAGWYKVESLLEYLPPWEAFVHPKCGLYQDFYLVLWAPPHMMESYAETPQGCEEHPHATWEPDECLPDDLDVLRKAAKKRWVEAQKQREKETGTLQKLSKVPPPADEGKDTRRKRPGEDVRDLPVSKLAKAYYLDLSRHAHHGLQSEFGDLQPDVVKSQIKAGWPKHPSEYPRPHAAADPPGCCRNSCSCMEDWHVGNVSGTTWLDNNIRNQAIQNTIDSFKCQNIHRIRGQVTKQWYFEPMLASPPNDPSHQSRRQALQVAQIVHKSMEAAVIPLPLAALTEEGAHDILQSMTILQDDETPRGSDIGGPFQPVAFEKMSGPDWLLVNSTTGQVSTIARDTPRAFKAETFSVQVDFIGSAENRVSFTLQVGPTKPALPENLAALTGQIMDRVRSASNLIFPVEGFIKQVYDTDGRCLRKKVTLAGWLRIMKQVHTMAQAASNSAQD